MYICGPHRFATGLIKLSSKNTNNNNLTRNDLYTKITSYTPDCSRLPSETVYQRKNINPDSIQSLTITIQAGEIVTAEIKTYEGDIINSPITGTIDIQFAELPWIKNILENTCKEDNVIIEDVKDK